MMNAGLVLVTTVLCALLVRLFSIGLPAYTTAGHIQHLKWPNECGPNFSLKLGSQTVIVLASGSMIKRLIDKRSGNYADRPSLFMQGVFEQARIILRGYDDLWKVERKLYHGLMNGTKATRYAPYQDLEPKQLCFDLLDRPEAFEAPITRMTLSAATSMTCGFRVTDPQNPVM
ncbi:hypothetical protein A1O7_02859 [Cladophialophora yegresii CBS 114405]|uniref:Uncharacterized protein n=1 Tax=Cladophialophora yegresii CBS 114405 TaxID=1182544 RepID=W9WVX1_9EURO|nr:uncharacterized protein A1O7_02859 [Cladophialophora yegresii CBS 114405]EXJ62424.1 hypothetical protein A1O7_02859 [Cladophialophora yegresii CBS 114405]